MFYDMEPFGLEADLYGHASTQAVIVNLFRDKKHRPVEPSDFIPKFGRADSTEAIGFARAMHEFFKKPEDGSLE